MRKTWVVCAVLAIGCGKKEETPEKVDQPRPTLEEQAKRAEAEVRRAGADAEAAMEAVEALEQQNADLQKRMDAAIDAVASAQTDADRQSASAALGSIRREKAELENKIGEAKAKAARLERLKGVKISKECLDNPLAKGCQ